MDKPGSLPLARENARSGPRSPASGIDHFRPRPNSSSPIFKPMTRQIGLRCRVPTSRQSTIGTPRCGAWMIAEQLQAEMDSLASRVFQANGLLHRGAVRLHSGSPEADRISEFHFPARRVDTFDWQYVVFVVGGICTGRRMGPPACTWPSISWRELRQRNLMLGQIPEASPYR